jgi:hypothetical protein
MPQFPLSDDVSTHPLPQWVSPPVHSHAPAVQTIPVPHTWPHAPQLFGSLWSGMHAPLQ